MTSMIGGAGGVRFGGEHAFGICRSVFDVCLFF